MSVCQHLRVSYTLWDQLISRIESLEKENEELSSRLDHLEDLLPLKTESIAHKEE